jgi:dienelactone hydrolase
LGASPGDYAPAPQAVWSPPASRGTVYRPPPVNVAPEKRRLGWKLWAPIGVGVLGVLLLGGWFAVRVVQKVASAAGRSGGIAAVKVADFPDRPAMRELEPGVVFCDIRHGDTSRAGLRLWLYLPSPPAGQQRHPAKSLPCVLVAPAGSNMITGMDLSDEDRSEHLPYVKAGFAVVAYELDGHVPGGVHGASDRDVIRAIKQFMASDGGVANGKAALEYVLAKIPEVDPSQIYTAGHSSAGTVSLLMAIHEPRVKGAVAYSPCYDIEKFQGTDDLKEIDKEVSGVLAFARKTSPAKLPPPKCPVFVFHAQGDDVVPASESQQYASQMNAWGKVTLSLVPEGDHHDSMIEQGIPQGIKWLKEHGAKPYATAGGPARAFPNLWPPAAPAAPTPMRAPPMPPVPPMPAVPAPPRPQSPTNQAPAVELGAVSPDAAMLAELGDEESVGAYKVRAPKGWRGFGAGPTRTWRKASRQGFPAHMSITVRPTGPNMNARKAIADHPAQRALGDLSYCTINGREFARLSREHPSNGTITYIGYDADKEISIRMMYDPRDPKGKDLVEAAARTIR